MNKFITAVLLITATIASAVSLVNADTGNKPQTTSSVTESAKSSADKKSNKTEVTGMSKDYITEKTDKKVIAITFDDGPNTGTTKEILDLAEKYGVRFSFFVIGQNINQESAKSMKRAHDLGCEINSHSFTHSYMDKMSAEDIKNEMDRTAQLIYDAVGEYPKFFRPPYIAVNSTMYDAIDIPFISGVGCNDWDVNVSTEKRVKYVTKKCGDGCIVLLHDAAGNSQTVEAMKEIIPYFLNEGYQFVTVSELFAAKGLVPSSTDEVIYSYATKSGWAQ